MRIFSNLADKFSFRIFMQITLRKQRPFVGNVLIYGNYI